MNFLKLHERYEYFKMRGMNTLRRHILYDTKALYEVRRHEATVHTLMLFQTVELEV